MRTRRFLTTSAAVLLMLAIIGSGFSYWFFQTKNNVQITVYDNQKEVTQLVAVGTITPASSFKVKFDQTEAGRTTYGGNADLGTNDSHSGITIVFADTDTKKATYTSPTDGITDKVDGKIQPVFSVKISITKELAKYLSIATTDGNWSASAVSYSSTGDEYIFEFTSTASNEFDWEKVNFSYNTKKTSNNEIEPATVEAYNTFKAIVEDEDTHITVQYIVTLTNP